MNNLSVTSLQQLVAGILELRQTHSKTYQRVWFDTPVLRTPSWQSLQLLPESYADKLQETLAWMSANLETEATRFKGFKDYELNRLDRDIAWMRNGQQLDPNYVKQQQADFYRFFSEHDRRRQTDFLTTFPEMTEWWTQCKYHANHN
jgi:hypothetical protein